MVRKHAAMRRLLARTKDESSLHTTWLTQIIAAHMGTETSQILSVKRTPTARTNFRGGALMIGLMIHPTATCPTKLTPRFSIIILAILVAPVVMIVFAQNIPNQR